MNFRIYYGDGSTFDGTPEQAPVKIVTAIAWDDPDKGTATLGRVVLREWDIYIYSDPVGAWHGTNKYADLMNHLALGCGVGGVRAVLPGLWVNRTWYFETLERAKTDPPFSRKSSNHLLREDGRA